jgi:hypothetical protein
VSRTQGIWNFAGYVYCVNCIVTLTPIDMSIRWKHPGLDPISTGHWMRPTEWKWPEVSGWFSSDGVKISKLTWCKNLWNILELTDGLEKQAEMLWRNNPRSLSSINRSQLICIINFKWISLTNTSAVNFEVFFSWLVTECNDTHFLCTLAAALIVSSVFNQCWSN